MDEIRKMQDRMESRAEADHDLLIAVNVTLTAISRQLNDLQSSTFAKIEAVKVELTAQQSAMKLELTARIAEVDTKSSKQFEAAVNEIAEADRKNGARLTEVSDGVADFKRWKYMIFGGAGVLGLLGGVVVRFFVR